VLKPSVFAELVETRKNVVAVKLQLGRKSKEG
jgi:hypothetical protein